MREMDVLSPGNSRGKCQYLQANPRREGLPKTVTEWKREREDRRRLRREERGRTGNSDLKSDSEGEELSPFDILNSSCLESGGGVRRSARIRGAKKGTSSSQGLLGSSYRKIASTTQQTAPLVLSPDAGVEDVTGTKPSTAPPRRQWI